MLSILKRWLGHPKPPAPAAAAAGPASISAPARPPEVEPEGFEAAWSLLVVDEPPLAMALDAEAEELAAGMADLLMAHFRANLPEPTSFPAVAARIVDVLNQDEPDLRKLDAVVGQDPAITAQVIRAANSALYQRDSEAQNLREAILRIGSRQVAEIALGVAGRSLFDVSLRMEFQLFQERWRELFVSTMTCAFGASQLAFDERVGRAERAFLGGMFHDIGMPLALRSLAAVLISGSLPSPLPEALVDEALDRVHQDIGAEVLALWGLPQWIQQLSAGHHAPELPAREDHAELHVLRLVTGLARMQKDLADLRHLGETRQSLGALGLDRRRTAGLWAGLLTQRGRVLQLYP